MILGAYGHVKLWLAHLSWGFHRSTPKRLARLQHPVSMLLMLSSHSVQILCILYWRKQELNRENHAICTAAYDEAVNTELVILNHIVLAHWKVIPFLQPFCQLWLVGGGGGHILGNRHVSNHGLNSDGRVWCFVLSSLVFPGHPSNLSRFFRETVNGCTLATTLPEWSHLAQIAP